MIKIPFKKGLVLGIIVLFLGISIVPLVGSNSIEKEQQVVEKGCLDGVELSGTMGEGDWYISDVVVTLDYPGYHIFYKIDSAEYQEYTIPFTVGGDGMHTVQFYYVDSEGEIFGPFVISFRIDATKPEITLTKEAIGISRVKFIADVCDETSGVTKVEFYLDSDLLYTVTSFPFEWTWSGFGNFVLTAKAFDAAGNLASSSMNTPRMHSFGHLIQNLILRHKILNRIFSII